MFTMPTPPKSMYINRLDPDDVFSSVFPRPFELDGYLWRSAEHYYQAMKYPSRPRFNDILNAPDGLTARRLGEGRLKRKRSDWRAIRQTIMSRALYTQARTHDDFAQALLESAELPIVNQQQYDYYWGTGRDLRGDNHYGKVLMRVRDKLRGERESDK